MILGSEVHIDIFDDRLTIYSPGGMLDGTLIQDCNLSDVPSARRNPVIADIFNCLGYMERQGSGLNKINAAYERVANFHVGLEPVFYSDNIQFKVTLKNLNYFALNSEKTGVSIKKQVLNIEKSITEQEKPSLSDILKRENIRSSTCKKIEKLFNNLNRGKIFTRFDVMELLEITTSPAVVMLRKLKTLKLIEAVPEHGRGKYRFVKHLN